MNKKKTSWLPSLMITLSFLPSFVPDRFSLKDTEKQKIKLSQLSQIHCQSYYRCYCCYRHHCHPGPCSDCDCGCVVYACASCVSCHRRRAQQCRQIGKSRRWSRSTRRESGRIRCCCRRSMKKKILRRGRKSVCGVCGVSSSCEEIISMRSV